MLNGSECSYSEVMKAIYSECTKMYLITRLSIGYGQECSGKVPNVQRSIMMSGLMAIC